MYTVSFFAILHTELNVYSLQIILNSDNAIIM